jgi:hypothetical protein
MKKYKATIEQIAARQEKRAKVRQLAKRVAGMTEIERMELAQRFPITTIEGRALSLHNQCLLIFQANGITPTLVGGFRQWKKAGRSVRKGQHGFSIWIPTGKKSEEGEIEDGEQVRFICGTVFDVTQTEESGAAEETAPASVEVPQLRNGERKTGELFQGAEAPFNLAGETGTDYEGQARESEQVQTDRAESELLQEAMPF